MMNNEMTKSNEQNILVGIDVGSTTTKIVAVDANDRHQLLFSDYARHHANQIASVIRSIKKFCGHIRDKKIRLCLTGSGAKPVASILKVPFVQEVAANAIALQDQFDQVGTAIELGGQDAKMIFFTDSEKEHCFQSVCLMNCFTSVIRSLTRSSFCSCVISPLIFFFHSAFFSLHIFFSCFRSEGTSS